MLLTLATFLVENGCDWEATNSAGAKASHILTSKGYPQVEIDELQAQYDMKLGRFAYGGIYGCVGQQGQCNQPTGFQLTCPHKSTFKACSKCMLNNVLGELKCECAEETITAIIIQQSEASRMEDSKVNILIDNEILFVKEEPGISSGLNWIYDGTPNGCIQGVVLLP